jgi:peroxiredoxin
VGTKAPTFSLSGLYGESLTLEALRASEKPLMLIFTDPGCGPCTAMLPEIGRWQQEHQEKLTISLISLGDPGENRTKASEHGLTNVLLQKEREVAEAYRVSGTSSALLVRPVGTIASPVAGGEESIRDLLAYAVGERAQLPMQQPAAQGQPCPDCGKVHAAAPTAVPATKKVGEPAPEVNLPDLEGEIVELKDFSGGEDILVLFWNPGCGFCQQMLPDLKEWEQNTPEGAPKLLFVSAGTEEANREMGLASLVVLDQQFSVGRAFGASGTPSAVLVDAEGKVASEVVVGAPAVLELAGASPTGP